MNSGYAVGIDLGTSNTVAILRFPDGRTRPVLFDGQPVLPSAVFLDHSGNLQVGRDAQRMAQLDPARFEPNPKRSIDDDVIFLGDRELPVTDVLAAPLRVVARAVTDTVGHLPPAVITCPAAWGTVRKGRLQQAATRAGWPPVHLMAEPIAAARYFTETQRRPIPVGQTLAIFDFGGGTLDVALVRNDGATFTVVGSGGAEDLGGLDIDAAIVAHLGQLLATQHPQVWEQISRPTDELARRNRRMFWDDVRAAKEMLSRSTTAPIAVPGVSASLHLTRDELEYLATPLLRRATGELSRALRQANLTPGQLCGIFLVGGTSRVPLVSRLLHAETGIAPTVLEQPELPVAEGAVAGAAAPGPSAAVPAQRTAPVSGSPSMPVSGMPVSGTPVSGTPSSGAPARPVTYAAPAPQAAPRPFATMAPPPMHQPMPHQPGQMYLNPRPPRAPRRYRAWPWLLAVLLVFSGLGYGVYRIIREATKDPLTQEQVITIDDLAPEGLQQAIVTGGWSVAVGQHTDGTVEVASVKHGAGTTVRHRSTAKGGWTVAVAAGNWVAVLSVPAADGSRVMMVSNAADNEFRETALAGGEKVTLSGTDPNGDLGYIARSDTANTVRYGIVGGQTATPGQPAGLPGGTRLLYARHGGESMYFIDGAGKILRYSAAGVEPGLGQAPPGHPTSLVHYDPVGRSLRVAEDKLGYQVLLNGSRTFQGPTHRKPVWIGRCGQNDEICVVDEVPDTPGSSRELFVLRDGVQGPRAVVPFADPQDRELAHVSEFVIVPTLAGERVNTVVVDGSRGSNRTHYDVDLRLLDESGRGGPIDALLLPARPGGTGPAVAATAQPMNLRGADFTDDGTEDMGKVTAILTSCDVGAGRLACATGTDFRVWKVDRG